MSRTPAAPDELRGVWEQIHRAASLAEALEALTSRALVTRGVERAVWVIHVGRELRGVAGVGVDEEAIRALVLPLSASDPVARSVRSGDRAEIPEGPLGLGRSVVLPLGRWSGIEAGSGALVLGLAGVAEEQVEAIDRLLRSVGPALEQLAELDRLRASSRELDRERSLLTSILNVLPDPVLITDPRANVLLENQRAEALFTNGAGESEGRRRAVEINNLLFASFLSRSVAPRDPTARELNLVDPTEGGDLLFEVLSAPLPSSAGGEGSTVSVLRDVTDLKRAATELEQQFKRMRQAERRSRRERDRLNLILENVGDPILVTDDRSNIIRMNPEAERLFEAPDDADLSDRWRRDVRANDTRFSSFISDFSLSPELTRAADLQLRDPASGRDFPVEVVSGKILNERSEMTAAVSIVHDLTKVVENETLAAELGRLNEGLEDRVRSATEQLEERNRRLEWQSQELERAYRLKSEFLASMSHELRTPINALLGYTALMRDRVYGDLAQRQEEALDRMRSASEHLLELVNDILDLARIEAGKMPLDLERVDIVQLVAELGQSIEPMARTKDLRYRVEIEPGIPTLRTDRTKVTQIVLNLLSNAVKFTREGEVSLLLRRVPDPPCIEIVVTDTGIGIRPEDLPNIFDDFRQVDQSSTREFGGTGLGLSITKKLLYLLSGTVRVESCMGEGSTFTVRIPIESRDTHRDEDAAHVALGADEAVVRVESGPNC